MANPFLPLWEYIPDGEPRVFGDRVQNPSSQAYAHVFSANFAADGVKNPCLVCNKIMLENPHTFLMKTGS